MSRESVSGTIRSCGLKLVDVSCCNHLPTDLGKLTLRGGVGHHGHGAALGSLQGSGLVFVLRPCASGCRSPCQLTACHSNPQLLRDGHGWLQ